MELSRAAHDADDKRLRGGRHEEPVHHPRESGVANEEPGPAESRTVGENGADGVAGKRQRRSLIGDVHFWKNLAEGRSGLQRWGCWGGGTLVFLDEVGRDS